MTSLDIIVMEARKEFEKKYGFYDFTCTLGNIYDKPETHNAWIIYRSAYLEATSKFQEKFAGHVYISQEEYIDLLSNEQVSNPSPVAYTSEDALADVYCGETSVMGPQGTVGYVPLYTAPLHLTPFCFYGNGAYYDTRKAAMKDGVEEVIPLFTLLEEHEE